MNTNRKVSSTKIIYWILQKMHINGEQIEMCQSCWSNFLISQVEITKKTPFAIRKEFSIPNSLHISWILTSMTLERKGTSLLPDLREDESKIIFSYSINSKVCGHSPAFNLLMNHWGLHLLTCNATSCFPACFSRSGCFCRLSWGHKRCSF